LRRAVAVFGDIALVRMAPAKKCAFVEMRTRKGAESAVAALHNSLVVAGVPLRVSWARPKGDKPPSTAPTAASAPALAGKSEPAHRGPDKPAAQGSASAAAPQELGGLAHTSWAAAFVGLGGAAVEQAEDVGAEEEAGRKREADVSPLEDKSRKKRGRK
jgi:hypothetical protein